MLRGPGPLSVQPAVQQGAKPSVENSQALPDIKSCLEEPNNISIAACENTKTSETGGSKGRECYKLSTPNNPL